jgi:tetratricopeptide (TPR) repeat protein
MRDSNFLFNYKVLQNNDIASATINAGWKRKVGAVANEDNLKKAGQGYDVIINEGYELQDCEKIIPSAVPESDLALAQQMAELVFQVSGLNMENWAGQQDKQISTLTMMMKQAANLMVFQKYFDQWDYALKLLGDLELKIVLNNWNAEKVKLLIGEEPTPYFYSKIFAKYKVMVEEGVETVTQQNMQAQQMLEINDRFGREVIPPSMIIKDMNIQGKSKILKFLEEKEKQASAVQEEAQTIQHAYEEAKLKELYSKAVSNLATARERQGRSESNIGLFEERLSMIGRNRALATKDKMEALQKLLESVEKYGELDTFFKEKQIDMMDTEQMQIEDREKIDAKSTAESNKFLEQIMGGMLQPQGMMNQGQQAPQMNENQMPEMAQMM